MMGCNGRAVLWVAAATAGFQVAPFIPEQHAQIVGSVRSYVAILSELYCIIAGLREPDYQGSSVAAEQQPQQEQEQEQALLGSASGVAGPAPRSGCVNSKETAQQLSVLLPAVLFYLPAHLPINDKANWFWDCLWAAETFRGWLRVPADSSSLALAGMKLSAMRDVCQDLMLLAVQTISKLLQFANAECSWQQ